MSHIFRPFRVFLFRTNQKVGKISATQYNVVGYTLMKGKKLIRGVLANVKEKIAEWQKMVCFYWGVINKGA